MYPGIAPQGKVYEFFNTLENLNQNSPISCNNIILIILILFVILVIVFKKYKKLNKDIYEVDKIKHKIHKYNEIKDLLLLKAYKIDNNNYIENFKDLNNIYNGLENVNNNINNLKMLIPGFVDM